MSQQQQQNKTNERAQLLALAKRATQHATQNGSISFGAPVSTSQIDATLKHFARRDIVKTLKFKSAKQMSEFAAGKIARASLDKQTQIALSVNAREIANALSIESNKFWTRKLATCAYVVHEQRKSAKRKSTRVAKSENVESEQNAS